MRHFVKSLTEIQEHFIDLVPCIEGFGPLMMEQHQLSDTGSSCHKTML